MIKVVDHTKIKCDKWADYVDNHPLGTIFHTRHFFSICASTPRLQPFALFTIDGSQRITGMLMGYYHTVTKIVPGFLSRRIILMNSPIVNDPISLELLLNELKKMAAFKAVYVEIRNHYSTENQAPLYEKAKFLFEPHLNIIVDLMKDEDVLWQEVSASRRKEIRKAIKQGFEFQADSDKTKSELYSILREIYSRARLPLYPESFFESIFRMPTECFNVLGLLLGDVVVGAVLVLKYKATVYGFFGGSREEYYKLRPNDLLFWSAFLWAKKNGYGRFDWLGAGHPDKPYGVRDWKKQFGGNMVNNGRNYYYPCKPFYSLAESTFSLFRGFGS